MLTTFIETECVSGVGLIGFDNTSSVKSENVTSTSSISVPNGNSARKLLKGIPIPGCPVQESRPSLYADDTTVQPQQMPPQF